MNCNHSPACQTEYEHFLVSQWDDGADSPPIPPTPTLSDSCSECRQPIGNSEWRTVCQRCGDKILAYLYPTRPTASPLSEAREPALRSDQFNRDAAAITDALSRGDAAALRRIKDEMDSRAAKPSSSNSKSSGGGSPGEVEELLDAIRTYPGLFNDRERLLADALESQKANGQDLRAAESRCRDLSETLATAQEGNRDLLKLVQDTRIAHAAGYATGQQHEREASEARWLSLRSAIQSAKEQVEQLPRLTPVAGAFGITMATPFPHGNYLERSAVLATLDAATASLPTTSEIANG